MYKKILVPLDGSKRAEAVLPHVKELVCDNETQIILIQVIEPQFVFSDPHGFNYYSIEEVSRETQQEEVETYLARVAKKFRAKNISVKTIIEFGSIAHSILKVAKREEVDLIAMSSHGRTGLGHVFYGSVAASVLHLVDRPLLLIRA
jgi:nucleotide-binding universal stress UspA family protein